MGMLAWGFIAIACATVDAVAKAILVMSSHVSISVSLILGGRHLSFDSQSCCSCLWWLMKSDHRKGPFD